MRFEHGVSSADPSPTGVSLWTRVSGTAEPVDVQWELAQGDRWDTPVASGTAHTDARADHCVRVRVEGLPPGWCSYRFRVGEVVSPTGRTAPLPPAPESFRIGVVSCARYGSGYFHAYRLLADEEPDLVLHLGDYIYEDGEPCVAGRAHRPAHRLRTEEDYVARYDQHRRDADLQALHAVAPWCGLWDDHETADNLWRGGAAGHDDTVDGPFAARVAHARAAARRWGVADLDHGDGALDRLLRLGSLADVWLVDTRHGGREAPVDLEGAPSRQPDDDRRLLTDAHRARLVAELGASTARWRLVANQVQVAPLRLSYLPSWHRRAIVPVVNPDQWDGYPAEREALLDALRGGPDTVLLSADLHAAFLTGQPGAGGAVPELTTTSVTAPTMGAHAWQRYRVPPFATTLGLRALNRHLRHADLGHHGCSVVTIEPDRIGVTMHRISHVDRPAPTRHRPVHAELTRGASHWRVLRKPET